MKRETATEVLRKLGYMRETLQDGYMFSGWDDERECLVIIFYYRSTGNVYKEAFRRNKSELIPFKVKEIAACAKLIKEMEAEKHETYTQNRL